MSDERRREEPVVRLSDLSTRAEVLGDADAFLARYGRAVRSYLWAVLKDPDLVHDAVSRLWVKAKQGAFADWTPNSGRFRLDLRTVILNEARQLHRGRGRAGHPGAGPGQLDARGVGRPPEEDSRDRHLPLRRAAVLLPHRDSPVPPHLPLPAGRRGQAGEGEGGLGRAEKKAAGGLLLQCQEEGRFQMVPTLAATLGVKGHRPVVGTRDRKDVLSVFAVLNLHTGAVHANTSESFQAANRKTGESKTRRMQRAFADHLRHVGRRSPQAEFPRVVLTIDNAPWHRGPLIDAALAENPHLEFYRIPSYSPPLNVIERVWKNLRRRATHNRLFDAIADLKASVRNGLRYFQSTRSKLRSLINGRPKKATE
jgi:transposase